MLMIITYYTNREIFDNNKTVKIMLFGIFMLIAITIGLSILGPSIFSPSRTMDGQDQDGEEEL